MREIFFLEKSKIIFFGKKKIWRHRSKIFLKKKKIFFFFLDISLLCAFGRRRSLRHRSRSCNGSKNGLVVRHWPRIRASDGSMPGSVFLIARRGLLASAVENLAGFRAGMLGVLHRPWGLFKVSQEEPSGFGPFTVGQPVQSPSASNCRFPWALCLARFGERLAN